MPDAPTFQRNNDLILNLSPSIFADWLNNKLGFKFSKANECMSAFGRINRHKPSYYILFLTH